MFTWWNVHVMKGKMKGIYLCFLLWNITTGLILSCIQLRYIVYEKNPQNQGTYCFLIFKVNNHETRNIISVRLKLKCLVFKTWKITTLGVPKRFKIFNRMSTCCVKHFCWQVAIRLVWTVCVRTMRTFLGFGIPKSGYLCSVWFLPSAHRQDVGPLEPRILIWSPIARLIHSQRYLHVWYVTELSRFRQSQHQVRCFSVFNIIYTLQCIKFDI